MNKDLQVKTNKGIVKGTALTFAAVMSVACFPGFVADENSAYADASAPMIYISGSQADEVSVGTEYQIKDAYYKANATDAGDGTKVTNIEVTYIPTGKSVTVTDDKFSVDYIGSYNISYKFEYDTGKFYTLDRQITATKAEETMSFEEENTDVLPTIYDLTYDKVKDGDVYKDITLPLPKVTDKDDKEIEVECYTTKPSDEDLNRYILVSAKNSKGTALTLEKESDKISIKGTNFSAESELGEYTISYSLYVKSGSSKFQCVSTVEKTFTVKKDYYKDYSLKANIGSIPTYVAGVEKELLAPTATATFKNSVNVDTTESVNITYQAKIEHLVNGNWVDVSSDIVDNKFTAKDTGNYKISYTVTDFYGNTATTAIKNFEVEDSQAPEVFMYDASDVANYKNNTITDGIDEYVDATSKLKTKSNMKNIVIYAIGATDNFSTLDKITLTRSIKNPSSIKTEITEYNEYNLIFNYDYDNRNSNYFINSLLTDVDEANAVKTLRDNKYLIVLQSIAKVTEISGFESVTEDTIEEKKEDLKNAGYAYIKSDEIESKGEYTITYSAEDEAGKSVSLDTLTMTLAESVEDTTAPEIKISTVFADSYTTKDVIEFAEPTATDEIDSRMIVKTTYQYMSDKNTVINGTEEELTEEYKIDLSARPTEALNAKYVKITVTATDDFGNTGTYEKILAISDIEDTTAPTVTSVGSVDSEVYQNTEVDLPTVVYSDNYVAIMSAKVNVYLLDDNGNRTKEISTYGSSTEYQEWGSKSFTFDAGTVLASTAGKYEVVVEAKDPGNNIIATYYYFTVKSTAKDYFKLNVSSTINEDGTATVGEAVVLDVPKITYSLANSNKKIYGVDEDGTAQFYSISVKDLEFTKSNKTTYTFAKAGTGTVKYTTWFAVYDSTKLSTDDNGVYYTPDEGVTKYYAANDYKAPDGVALQTAFSSKYSELTNSADLAYVEKTLTSDDLTLTVSESEDSKTFEINNGEESIYASSYAVEDTIEIFHAAAEGDIDPEKSTVTISHADGDVATTVYKFSEFKTGTTGYDETTDSIEYTFTKNGKYTITYKVVDTDGVEYAAKSGSKSYTISVGDTEKPTIEAKDGFLEDEYALNSKLTLDIAKLVLTDNGVGNGSNPEDTSTRNTLLSNLTIKITRTDDDGNTKTIENIADADNNEYQYELDVAGTYTITIITEDKAGNESAKFTDTFEVSTKEKETSTSTETIGTILIVLACLVLAGVIAYFVISRIRMNKKSTRGLTKKSSKEEKKD